MLIAIRMKCEPIHPESLFAVVISAILDPFQVLLNEYLSFCFLVIDILDELKKEQREARDAIRWLENQFRLVNRYLKII